MKMLFEWKGNKMEFIGNGKSENIRYYKITFMPLL